MPQLTLLEKLEVLFANVEAYPLFLILFSIPVIAYLISKIKFKKSAVIIYLLGFILILAKNFKEIPILFDNLVEYIINIMNFPTIGLIFGIVITEVVIITMTFINNYRINIKIINSLGFILIQIMFGISLQIIANNNMDISTVQNLTASLDLMTLLQMIMLTFIVQLFLIFVSKMIDMVTNYLDSSQGEKNVVNEMVDSLTKTVKEDVASETLPAKKSFVYAYEASKNKFKEISSSSKEKIEEKREESALKRETKKAAKLELIQAKKDAKMEIIEAKKAAKLAKIETKSEPVIIKNNEIMQTKQSDEFNYSLLKPVNVVSEKTCDEITVNEPVEEKTRKAEILEIAAKVDSITTSNKFITEATRTQMEEELLAYKEQLLIYRQEQLKKEELAKKQKENFNNIFNISYEDLKKKY